MENFLKNKSVLITGGTGSFATAMLDYLIGSDIREVRIFSRDEKKQDDMRRRYDNPKISFIIGDVRDERSTSIAVKGCDFVFHAAALKQVPSCEFYPSEAVKTNVLGAENVMLAAIKYGVSKCVVLSTDKAVYPVNAMGMSKALMEKVMVALARTCDPKKTVLCATRYGNVMGSRGSVIPLFVELLGQKKPLTITNPKMTRFLMSLQDSVHLVMHAFQNAKPGDIFVKKSPASDLQTLAKALKSIFASDQNDVIIGTRHGEKLFESLISEEEMLVAEDNGDYFRIPSDVRGLNYSKYFEEGNEGITEHEDYTSHNTYRLNKEETIEMLLKLDFIKTAKKGEFTTPMA